MPPTYDPRMLLAVDIGNTNLTLGIVEDGALEAVRRAATTRASDRRRARGAAGGLLALDEPRSPTSRRWPSPRSCPPLTATLAEVAGAAGLPVLLASSGTVPIAIRVDRPDEVGADRLVNALAAARLYGAPAVVVDFGTATTLDCVGADGAYVGGAIAPGPRARASRRSPRGRRSCRGSSCAPPDRAIGRDTVGAIQAGTVFGYQALAPGCSPRGRGAELAEAGDRRPSTSTRS